MRESSSLTPGSPAQRPARPRGARRLGYKPFTCSYPFEGGEWGFEIMARSHEEAEARLRAMPWARVDGQVIATIPAAGVAAAPLVGLWVWLRNAMKGGAG